MPEDYPVHVAYGALRASVELFLIGFHDCHDLERKLLLCELVAQGTISQREALRRFYVLDRPEMARRFEEVK